jgi:hypothetical protein
MPPNLPSHSLTQLSLPASRQQQDVEKKITKRSQKRKKTTQTQKKRLNKKPTKIIQNKKQTNQSSNKLSFGWGRK